MKFDFMFPTNLRMPFGAEGEGNDQNANGGQQGNNGSDGGAENNGFDKDKGKQGGQQNQEGASSSSNAGSDDDDDEYAGYTPKELKRLLKDTQQSVTSKQAELDQHQADKDAAERAKNDKETNLTNDLKKANDEIAALKSTIAKQAITSAILSDTRFTWHDPEMVVAQLNNEIVKVDKEGKVQGMKPELTRIAKEFPFLVKSQESNNSGKNNQGGQQNNGPTGFQPGQGGTSTSGGDKAAASKLAENYPALATRS